MLHSRCLAVIALLAGLPLGSLAADNPDVREILETTGVQGGLIVHLGCGDGKLTAGLRISDAYQVHGLTTRGEDVAAIRHAIRKLGVYGDVSVDRLAGRRLSYVDNMVNLLVAEDLGDVAMDEVMRVLVPQGVAFLKTDEGWKKSIKPRPQNIDEWTHYLHDAGGNAVANDTVVGPPKHLQWLGSPRWSRHHDRMASMSAMVSAGGRIFYIMDEGSRISIQMPSKWTLVARDAFNGVVLWKRPIPKWHHHLWPLKSGPTQLARRLVATGDRVYVTLGFTSPVEELDAATGETIRQYEDTAGAEELIVSGDHVVAMVNDGISELAEYVPAFNTGDQRRVFNEFLWNKKPRRIVVADVESGKKLWQRETIVAPLTLSADTDRVFFHDGEKVVCVDRQTGEMQWHSEPAERGRNTSFNFGPRLVVNQGIVLFAGGDRTMRAFEAKSGKEMWTSPHARGGYQSPEDLLVVQGMVWSAPTTSGRDSGVFTGRDMKTGEVKIEFPPNVETYWFHHRCYIAKATERFILPSRTGIEFVDFKKKDWDINHWVRGGCLYGIMPCNGLTYAPPHNCACYPEAKVYGMNALAPAAASRQVAEVDQAGRLEHGLAFGKVQGAGAKASDWPTFRANSGRTGFAKTTISGDASQVWLADFGDKLSTLTVAGGSVYVAQVNQHSVHALDEATGKTQWTFTTGGRVDSPPTIHRGHVLFGSADGWVYCLRASDGQLAWRFRAAPRDDRLMAFEQLESVWPVHGSVLVKDDTVYCVAGRSNYLDGGLRFLRLSLNGELLAESIIDDRDPLTGDDLQDGLRTLQMATGLADILSSDGQSIYMRSQQFDETGNRIAIGPHSGDAATQGAVQRGSTMHLFAPMGYLDDTYFHRSYWVYGRSSAGGHNGYYQAGKYTPSGRILVADSKNVYGFGRKPQYLKWTTTMEHQLFSSKKEAAPQALSEAPSTVNNKAARRGGGGQWVSVANSESLDPTRKAITVEAWVKSEKPNGVVVARGGPAQGYALCLRQGKPQFAIRAGEALSAVTGARRIGKGWVHLAGVLSEDKAMKLYANGKLIASGKASSLLTSDPLQTMEVGADDAGAVGDYTSPFALSSVIDEVRVYFRALTDEEVSARFGGETARFASDASLVLNLTFDKGKGIDDSGKANHAKIAGAKPVEGKIGGGLSFTGAGGKRRQAVQPGSFVQHNWTADVPLYARAMALANSTLFVAGPPDLIDEEETFQKIMARDPDVAKKLSEQDDALLGGRGGTLLLVDAKTGERIREINLASLPTWDGLAAANGRLFVSTTDGKIVCFGE